MPPPRSENDLKRRARRRLIGAVALTLLAVIVLPLLLEDEPPPASSLAVKMAPSLATERSDDAAAPSEPETAPAPIVVDATRPAPPQAAATAPEPPVTPSKPAPSPAPPKPAPSPEPPKPAVKLPAPQAKPSTTASETFVVQLAALSSPAKAETLRARAAKTGLPAYTDTLGSLTRVRVGPFSSRSAAVEAAVKLAEHGMGGQVLAK